MGKVFTDISDNSNPEIKAWEESKKRRASKTDLPWQITERWDPEDELEIIGGIDSVDGAYGVPHIVSTPVARLYATDDQTANAAYIVKACNAYPELLTLMKDFPGFMPDFEIADEWTTRHQALLSKLGD